MSDDRNYNVYIHTNRANNKKYVGTTSYLPSKRWNLGKGYKDNEDFYSDILLYGWDNFDHEVFENLTKVEAHNMEIDLISKFKSTDKEYGYNRRGGGCISEPKVNSKGQSVKTFSISMDQDLYDKIKDISKKNYRSLSQELCVAIETYLDYGI